MHDGVVIWSATWCDQVIDIAGYIWWIDQTTDPVRAQFSIRDEAVEQYGIQVGDRNNGPFTRERLDRLWRWGKAADEGTDWLYSFSVTVNRDLWPVLTTMKHLENYFRRCAETEPSFTPELQFVVSVLEAADRPAPDISRLRAIRDQASHLDPDTHYNGSGWLDFQLVLNAMLRQLGLP